MSADPKETRRVVGEIRAALDTRSREELVEILSYVFKEYVVEGAAPLASGAGAILDARSELDGLSFAQVIAWLQSHLDHPELRLFDVIGERVSVRVGGRPVPLQAQEQAEPLAPAGSVRAAATTAPLQVGAPPAPAATANAPTSGPANAPNASAGASAAPAPPNAPPAAPGAAPAAGAAQPAKDEKEGAASSRFSLLEVD